MGKGPLPGKAGVAAGAQALPLPDIVLVHGAWCGGWIWQRLAALLEAAGHRVHCPTLAGLEDGGSAAAEVDLATHIVQVAGLIEELEGSALLVGHSYGGMVVTGAADALPAGRIAALVIVDGFVPEDGKALVDYAPLPSAPVSNEAGRLVINPVPAAPPRNNAADCDWLNALRRPHPLACFTQPVRLSGRAEAIARKDFILATGYPGVFGQFAARLQDQPGWHCHELACGHDVMLAQPRQLAQIILHAATAATEAEPNQTAAR